MTPQHFVPKLVTSALIGVGFWLVYFSWGHISTSNRLERDSAVTEGRVLSSATRRTGSRGQSYTLVVEYTPAGHSPMSRTFDVDGSAFTSATTTGTVPVVYLPGDPTIARVTDFAVLPFQLLLGFAVMVLLSGLFLLGRLLMAGRSR